MGGGTCDSEYACRRICLQRTFSDNRQVRAKVTVQNKDGVHQTIKSIYLT